MHQTRLNPDLQGNNYFKVFIIFIIPMTYRNGSYCSFVRKEMRMGSSAEDKSQIQRCSASKQQLK